ncbi:glutathione S-transferase [Agrobacterium sp. a22-2]|uniref:MAPEG family protein n=1 Tax=Agrobacterium sp. a22-2 TaxID=2283840 RepID=UPI0014471B64|nr:MAPEG family protein [Agrobacterium sp. a22-2]NKN36221.1 glutathione S-transferase [Agrobacterium sp. a22-2]
MIFPDLTAFYGGLLGILFILLSVWVTLGRAQYKAHHGDGGQVQLQRRIRIHANFAEYVPLALLLIGLNEASGVESWMVRTMLIALMTARIIHPFGMLAPEGSLQQYALRAPAMVVTWIVILIASLLLITSQ